MTNAQLRMAMAAQKRAAGKLGGQTELAKVLSLKPQAISYRFKHSIPLQSAREVELVEAVTDELRYDLRPDLYPRPSTSGSSPSGSEGLAA